MKNKVLACSWMVSLATISPTALAVPAEDARSSHVGEGPRAPADALLGRWRPPNEDIVVEMRQGRLTRRRRARERADPFVWGATPIASASLMLRTLLLERARSSRGNRAGAREEPARG